MIKNELILYKLNNGCEKILCGPEKVHPVGMRERVVSFCHGQAERRKGDDPNTMGQKKQARGLASLGRATDTLSTLLAQQVRELNARQRENRRSGAEDPGTMKGLKEATAVLKDLAAVARSLNDQGVQAEGTESGVVLLPRVEEEEP